MSSLSASNWAFSRVDAHFIRGVTTSIQLEAAESTNKNVSPTARGTAERGGFISRDYRPLIINHYYGSDRSWDWSTRNITYVTNNYAPSQRAQTKEEKESERARNAVIMGSILTVITSAVVGYTYGIFNNQRESLNRTLQFKSAVETALESDQVEENISSSVIRSFYQLVNVQLSIDEIKTQKISNYFYAALGLLAGSSALVSGGFFLIPFLMTAGEVALVVSAAFGALNFGLHFNDESRLMQSYEQILGNPQKQFKGLADQILETLQRDQRQRAQLARSAEPSVSPFTSAWTRLSSTVTSQPSAAVSPQPLGYPPQGATAPPSDYQPLVPDCYVFDGVVLESTAAPSEAVNQEKTI